MVGVEKQIQASGFVILPRLRFKKLIDKMLYQHFMELANYQPSNNCERGQLIVSILKLSEETGWSYGVIRGAIKRLSDSGYITSKPMKQNKGNLITILNYDEYQNLGSYSKKINKQDNKPINKQDNKQEDSAIPCDTRSEEALKSEINKRDNKPINKEDYKTITAYINSINNINKTLKEYIVEAPVKNKNLRSTEDIEIFVDFALRTNALPVGISKKILVAYFDCIRLTRQTCTLSANILVKFIEKIQKYSINQIHYALWKHCEQHDDKRESYTLGILRNTKEHEARRGLIKLKNKGGVGSEPYQSSDKKYEYGF